MRYVDVTDEIHDGMAVYPGDPPVRVRPWQKVGLLADFAVSELRLGTHTGTHLDAPAHCFAGGAGVGSIALSILCGPAMVLDVAYRAAALEDSRWLNGLPHACTRLLLRTQCDGDVRQVGLGSDAARQLIVRGVQLVGIDRPSIACGGETVPVHRLLLAAGCVILEGLDLRQAEAGPCELLCLPLKTAAADGAPVRAVLHYP